MIRFCDGSDYHFDEEMRETANGALCGNREQFTTKPRMQAQNPGTVRRGTTKGALWVD
jgi:hypothetical protein